MARRLFWKTYPYYLFIIFISLILTAIIASSEMRRMYIEELTKTLEARGQLISKNSRDDLINHNFAEIDKRCKLLGQLTSTRITIVGADGTVLGDSDEDPAVMENHGRRPEIAWAFEGKTGVETRYSNTLRTTMMYVAVPVKNDDKIIAVVRCALSVSAINKNLQSFYRSVTISGIIIALLAAIIGSLVFRRITRPIYELKEGAEKFAKGQLRSKLPVGNTEEIATLAITMNNMAEQLDYRINKIIEQRNENEAILSGMSEGVIALDNDGKMVSFNRAAAEFFDLNVQKAMDRPIHELARFADLHEFIEETFKNSRRVEKEIMLPGSHERYLQAHGSQLKNAANERIGILLVFNDITRIKRLENIRKDFVANVSHELKTPITAITGSVETLLSGAAEDPGNNERFLKMISQHAARLNNLVEDLLSLARLETETDSMGVNLKRSKICDIIDLAIQTCHTKSVDHGIDIRVICPEEIEADVNSFHLEQAIINLIDNALKYSEYGKKVEIKAEIVGDKLVISVTDEGPGIEKQHLSRLFERFYRVDKGRSRDAGGTGLGLAIVKHVALAHKGQVSVESKPGQGSTFIMTLPVNG